MADCWVSYRAVFWAVFWEDEGWDERWGSVMVVGDRGGSSCVRGIVVQEGEKGGIGECVEW